MTTDCPCVYDSTGAVIVPDVPEEDFRLSLIVENGDDGLSAYQVAVKNGFVGNELQWLETLKPASSRYDIVYSIQGVILPYERLPDVLVVVDFKIPLNFAGSGAYASDPSPTQTVFDISKYDNKTNAITAVGTLTFEPRANFGTFRSPALQFGIYDRLLLAARENLDSTLANVSITFAAQR